MTIKHENGVVTFRMRTGKDFVRSTMLMVRARAILSNAKKTEEITYDNVAELSVDDTYFFPIDKEKKIKKREDK